MANLNKVLLMGNLTREPQSKALPQNGTPVCDLGMAVNRRYKTQSGEEREDVVYVDLIAYGYQADFCVKNMTKGSTVYVEGHLRYDSWQDKDTGKNRSKLRVIVDTILHLERRNAELPEQQAYPPMGYGQPPYSAPAYGQPMANYGYQQQPAYPPPQQPYQPSPQQPYQRQQPYQPLPQQPQQVAQPQAQPMPQQPVQQQPAQSAPQPQATQKPQATQPPVTVSQHTASQAAPAQQPQADPPPAQPPPQPSQSTPPSAAADEEVVDDMPF